MAKTLTSTRVRNELSEALNRVAYSGERIVLRRHGKPVAAMVPVADLRMIEEIEDRADIEAVRKARKEKGKPIPWEKIKRELGL